MLQSTNTDEAPDLHSLVNEMPALICCFKQDGTLTFVNDTYCKYFNKDHEELVGNNFFQFIPEEDRENVKNHYISLTPAKSTITYEHKVIPPSGEIRWMRWTDRALFNDHGTLTEYQSIGYDITEHKQTEECLKKNQALFISVIESLPFDFFAIDETGHYIVQNSVCKKRWGSVVGQRPEDVASNEEILDLWMDNNRRAFSGETVRGDIEHTAGDKKSYYHNIIAPIRSNGRITGILGVNIDITEQKKTEEALRESEEKYRGLVEDINEVVYALDEQAVVTYISPNIESLGGYKQSDVVGKSFTAFVYPEDLADRIPQFKKVLSGNSTASEYRMTTKSGDIRWVRTAARPIFKNGRVVGLRGILVDLTETKKAEEEKKKLEATLQNARKMEALGNLAGGVAHDLNNVLGGIVGYPGLLLSDLPDNSPLRKPLRIIEKSGEKSAAIVQDLLTLARRGVAINEIVNLNEIIREQMKAPEHVLLCHYHPDVRFETCLDDNLMNISGSPMHLSKTLMNLLSNAAEAMPSGGTVTITTGNKYIERPIRGYDDITEGDYAVLSLSDTGVGMSTEDKERIFEPFYTKKIMGRSGTGLGMAVVWGTVKDHCGYIDIDSRKGNGTTFTLYFPATAVSEKQVCGGDYIPLEKLKGKGETILIIDDVLEQRELASAILARLGYIVTAVSSGEEAVEYMRRYSADLLVLDMIMDPKMDGLETYKRILEMHPRQKAIIASGFSETDKVTDAQRLGAGAYVKKPYSMEGLGIAVK
ncbi:MAG: PAS domain S-box protein, partial [Deltaproteobacteria bacterium]|nr:PAS domain S-box protein [Deltaproteobacteria bacterium]